MTDNFIKPLPNHLVQRYRGWKANNFSNSKAWYEKLANDGQRPRAMIISCCDSRVNATTIFGADSGEFFIHRNIANLVPPFAEDSSHHGTSSAIEYAVIELKIPNIIVLGHSNCGGANAAFKMFSENKTQNKTIFIHSWLCLMEEGFKKLNKKDIKRFNAKELEKQSIIVSLKNLMTFPFVKEAVNKEKLNIHGLWFDIAVGNLEIYDPNLKQFIDV